MRSARSSLFRFVILGGLLGAAALGAFGCQSVAGIEERKFDSTSSDAPSEDCVEYCDTVMRNCVGGLAVYKTKEVCLDVCATLPPGDSEAGPENTLACRKRQADTAEFEPNDACPNAGPGGNGACGSDCEAWCSLLEEACPKDFDKLGGECLERCAGLSDSDAFDVDTFYATDTLQCRLIHIGAALSIPETHCGHSAYVPSETCVPPDDSMPTCEAMCQKTQANCTGDLAVWESEAQCLAACGAFELGPAGDTGGNTVACRTYHATTAGSVVGADVDHCQHAGPTGDGHCGHIADGDGNCHSYCTLLHAACKDEPGYPYAEVDACKAECDADMADKGADDDSLFSVKVAASGDTLQCRTLHAARAFTDAAQCAAALGGAPCE
jgi:hypothetical protein